MRIYLQIPYSGTEIDDADTGAIRARNYVPEALLGYQELISYYLYFTLKLLGYKSQHRIEQGLSQAGSQCIWCGRKYQIYVLKKTGLIGSGLWMLLKEKELDNTS
jgi:hypothetical protein